MRTTRRLLPVVLTATAACAWCAAPLCAQDTLNFPTIGKIVRHDDRVNDLIPDGAQIEVLASGFDWSEGPVWVADGGGYLLFSDIPRNSVMKWVEGAGVSLYMKPSGYTGVADYGPEPGSNGLLLDPQGRLVLCEHGDRRVSVLTKDGGKMTLADNYRGKRLNSPNDGAWKSNGDLYFTDPPYGLPNRYDDRRRELEFCGVYRLSKRAVVAGVPVAGQKRLFKAVRGKGAQYELTLLTDEMTRPNGIAFSPDEKTLYVAQSDPEAAIWKTFPVNEDGTLGEGRVFYDVTDMVGHYPGLPDGMKVDRQGNLFATGPGGVHVFAPDGTPLGRIDTGEKTANCAWGNDGSVLYMTADMYLCRVKTTTRGSGW